MKIRIPENLDFATERDKKFFERVYGFGDLRKYVQRLSAIGFEGFNSVLDAGAGFGQWAMSMARHNNKVTILEVDKNRIKIAKEIALHNGIGNVEFITGENQCIPLPDESFDAIFSYSALNWSPYRETLKEFNRILKPNGMLYFNANDLGWYIYNIIEQHNPSEDFSPREWAINSIANTIKYFASGKFNQSTSIESIVIPIDTLKSDISNTGFEIIELKGDGKINLHNVPNVSNFFEEEKYGLPCVYEVLCRKSGKHPGKISV